jgi:hypothetical protein
LLLFLLTVAHLIGLALGMGAATAKLFLLLRCRRDTSFLKVYLEVARTITRQIIAGMILLTLSGLGFLFIGFPFTSRLTVKVVFVAALWALGPMIDNVVEPKFRTLAPEPGAAPSPEFITAQRRYVAIEVLATSLFYLIVVIWLWR